MKKTNSIVAMLLLTGFSANTILAENPVVNVKNQIQESFERIKQINRDSIYTTSQNIDAVLNIPKEIPHTGTTITLPNQRPNKPTNIKDIKPTPNKPKRPVADKLKDGRKNRLPNPKPEVSNTSNLSILMKIDKTSVETKKDFVTVSLRTQVRINKKGKLEVSNAGQRRSRSSIVHLVWHEASNNEINRLFFIGKNVTELSKQQNELLKERLGAIINSPHIKKFIITIRTAEGGGGLVIVGKGRGKSKAIQDKIARLNYGSHPAEQLPRDAFVINKRYGKISTASGEPQITYSNWKLYKKHFGFDNFSIRNQRIACLDLARGSHGGFGFICLLKGGNGFKYGTQPWESSKNSTLGKRQIKTIDFNKLSQTAKVAKIVADDKDV